MTILVLSDSHGNVGNMIRAVEQVQPDRVLHLGDCQREYGAQVLLFGHTHVPLVDNDGTLLTLNPGAAGDRLHPTCGILTIDNGHADVRTLAL